MYYLSGDGGDVDGTGKTLAVLFYYAQTKREKLKCSDANSGNCKLKESHGAMNRIWWWDGMEWSEVKGRGILLDGNLKGIHTIHYTYRCVN